MDETLDAVVELSLTVTATVSRIAADHGLSLTLARLLGILRDRTPRMADLADHLGLERSTMSGLVARAEARGLVTRTTDADDARAARVALTSMGRALADAGHAEIGTALAPMLARLGSAGRHRATMLLRAMLG